MYLYPKLIQNESKSDEINLIREISSQMQETNIN